MHPVRGSSFDGRGLTLPAPDARPVGPLFARYLAMTCRSFLSMGEGLPGPLRARHRRLASAVTRASARDARRTLGCFASPTVGTAIQCFGLRAEMPALRERIDRALEAALPCLGLELALRGLVAEGEALELDAPATSLASLSLGVAIGLPPDAVRMRLAAGQLTSVDASGAARTLRLDQEGLRAPAEGFSIEAAYRPIGKVTRFALRDHNPIASFETHPHKAGNDIDLGEASADAWTRMLEEALALVEAFLPEVHAEMATLLHEIVPVGYDPVRHLSASYREAIGTVYMTLHPSLMTMTEAVVHEFQHNKVNLASYSADFLENAFYPVYPSPVRPDPRPLWGILLAVHAFLPVAVLYRRMRAAGHPRAAGPDFERRLGDIDLKNHEGMEMLRRHAVWGPTGLSAMAELEAIDRAHMAERAGRGLDTSPVTAHVG